jgi:predicted transcriptional regulator
MADADQSNLTSLTVDLLSAYVANNSVEHGALSELIKSTHAALKVIDAPEPPAPEEPEHKPAVSVKKSLSSASHIISLIDGKPYQTLKRHLSKHGLTAEQYRERYGLPKTYPMVAKAYSESRRAIAERLGLGRRGKGAPPEAASAVTAAGQKAEPKSDVRAKAVLSPAHATTPVAGKERATGPEKAKAATEARTAAKTGTPASTRAPAKKTSTTSKAPPSSSSAKARKAAAPTPVPSPVASSEKPAPRKRSAKTAVAAS